MERESTFLLKMESSMLSPAWCESVAPDVGTVQGECGENSERVCVLPSPAELRGA